jgi:hypothetical protein
VKISGTTPCATDSLLTYLFSKLLNSFDFWPFLPEKIYSTEMAVLN